jgi:hypothetical protein
MQNILKSKKWETEAQKHTFNSPEPKNNSNKENIEIWWIYYHRLTNTDTGQLITPNHHTEHTNRKTHARMTDTYVYTRNNDIPKSQLTRQLQRYAYVKLG